MITARIIRPGPVTEVEWVAPVRAEAQRETFDRLAHALTDTRCASLDALLVSDAQVGMSRRRWLSTGPVEASSSAVKTEISKLKFLRSLGAEALDLSVLPAERRRLSVQALERRDPQRRYPILLTILAQSGTEVLDEVVQHFDQAISTRESKAARMLLETLAERGKAGEGRRGLLDELLAIIFDLAPDDEQIGGLIQVERIGWERLRKSQSAALPPSAP